MKAESAATGAVIFHRELDFKEQDGVLVSRPVGPALGARLVALDVVRIPPGQRWTVREAPAEENNVVVFAGSGLAEVGTQQNRLQGASTVHAPTGSSLTLTAADAEELTVYLWRTRLDRPHLQTGAPKLFGSLWDDDQQLVGFTGYGGVDPGWGLATMNFVFWPGSGSARLCLHCGVQQPRETFAVHLHPHSEEAFIAFEGTGQLYLHDRWFDVAAGDILFAPPGIRHGARNPQSGTGAARFVTCGGPTPFDPVLYERAGVSAGVR